MIIFNLGKGNGGTLGVFCVVKKNGELRFIFDARRMNRRFKDPPSVALPTASAFPSLEIDDSCTAFTSSADLSNAFYAMTIPRDLAN